MHKLECGHPEYDLEFTCLECEIEKAKKEERQRIEDAVVMYGLPDYLEKPILRRIRNEKKSAT